MNPEQKKELKENFYQPTPEREVELIEFINKLLNEQRESILEIVRCVVIEDVPHQYQKRLLSLLKIN